MLDDCNKYCMHDPTCKILRYPCSSSRNDAALRHGMAFRIQFQRHARGHPAPPLNYCNYYLYRLVFQHVYRLRELVSLGAVARCGIVVREIQIVTIYWELHLLFQVAQLALVFIHTAAILSSRVHCRCPTLLWTRMMEYHTTLKVNFQWSNDCIIQVL